MSLAKISQSDESLILHYHQILRTQNKNSKGIKFSKTWTIEIYQPSNTKSSSEHHDCCFCILFTENLSIHKYHRTSQRTFSIIFNIPYFPVKFSITFLYLTSIPTMTTIRLRTTAMLSLQKYLPNEYMFATRVSTRLIHFFQQQRVSDSCVYEFVLLLLCFGFPLDEFWYRLFIFEVRVEDLVVGLLGDLTLLDWRRGECVWWFGLWIGWK